MACSVSPFSGPVCPTTPSSQNWLMAPPWRQWMRRPLDAPEDNEYNFSGRKICALWTLSPRQRVPDWFFSLRWLNTAYADEGLGSTKRLTRPSVTKWQAFLMRGVQGKGSIGEITCLLLGLERLQVSKLIWKTIHFFSLSFPSVFSGQTWQPMLRGTLILEKQTNGPFEKLKFHFFWQHSCRHVLWNNWVRRMEEEGTSDLKSYSEFLRILLELFSRQEQPGITGYQSAAALCKTKDQYIDRNIDIDLDNSRTSCIFFK